MTGVAEGSSSASRFEASIESMRREFARTCGAEPSSVSIVVSPYRICPIGAHSDHQGGPVLGSSIDANTLLAFKPNPDGDDSIRLTSANYPGVVDLSIGTVRGSEPMEGAEPAWGRYARAAVAAMRPLLPSEPRGFVGHLQGMLPGSGLSSSASVLLAYVEALAQANSLELTDQQRVQVALAAEREFVNVKVGVLDPASIVAGRKGALLAIDTELGTWRHLRTPASAEPSLFLVVFSGTPRNLVRSPYNDRVEECLVAVRELGRLSGRVDAKGLNAFTDEEFERHGPAISEIARRRATHFFTERSRVRKGMAAWTSGDLDAFGRLMTLSCQSSIENWEAGAKEIIAIHEFLQGTPGILGSRFSGAGFGGAVVALVREGVAERVRSEVASGIERRLGSLVDGTRAFLARSDDGLRLR